ncbi:MAG: hypothetical protein M1828_003484 [Chrysothrix sp. TS-e1954]|nr:MAG: hypothetical protein M1828_003484 [Chrysothrix sp. TS-e1954]
MLSVDRDESGDRQLHHQHSSSDLGRLSVPMWDSSDPERAPPPLPLNPGHTTPNSSPTRGNTSATVAAAAQALVERARDSFSSPYTANTHFERSPGTSPSRSPHHKRLQSLQNVGFKDLASHFENTSENGNSRAGTPERDSRCGSPERSLDRSRISTPMPGAKEVPVLRPSARPPPRPLVADSQAEAISMPIKKTTRSPGDERTLADISNGSTSSSRTAQNFESIHSQMQNLTVIANALQKEMVSLSRRSKDNATDLIALKDATKKRDEHIRSSLQKLTIEPKPSELALLGAPRPDMSRSASALAAPQHVKQDDSPFNTPLFNKSFSIPKFAPFDNSDTCSQHDRTNSPAPRGAENAASIAMLEKIMRDMGTKEGQERMSSSLTEIISKSTKDSLEVSRKVEELLDLMQEKTNSKALVKHTGRIASGYSDTTDAEPPARDARSRSMQRLSPGPVDASTRSAAVSQELAGVLQKIKDSVSQSGGMTAELKATMKALRGEVLGMGRELGQKLDGKPLTNPSSKDLVKAEMSSHAVESIVQKGLKDLQQQMDQVIQTRRRQSAESVISRSAIDSDQIYEVVKHALAEHGLERPGNQLSDHSLGREEIVSAVRDAYDSYKPEIQIEQYGLERNEILQCLKEGLEDYQASKPDHESDPVSREEILNAIQDGLQHFTPPSAQTEAGALKEEILLAVKEGFESYRPPSVARSAMQSNDLTREDVMEAVQEGLGHFRKHAAREIELNPDDLFAAVKAGLENMPSPFGAYGEQVVNSLNEIVEGMRVEFKGYSEANGLDTSQVLNALSDGLERLRAEVETYVDRAQDVTGKDEIIHTLKSELEALRESFENFVSQGTSQMRGPSDQAETINYIKAEFQHLHETIESQPVAQGVAPHHQQVLSALESGFAELRANAGTSRGFDDQSEEREDRLEAIKAELDQLREAILHNTAMQKDEILENLQESVASLNTRLDHVRSNGGAGNEVLDSLRQEFEDARSTLSAPVLHPGPGSTDKDSIVDALRESLDNIRVQLSTDQNEANNESLGVIREELENLREAVGGSLMLSAPGVDKEAILDAVRSGLEGSAHHNQARTSGLGDESLQSIRDEIEQLRNSLSTTLVKGSVRGDTEEILEAVRTGLEAINLSTGETALDNLNENLINIRGDIAKLADRPVDMSASDEILDTLKKGLDTVKADIDRLHGSQTLSKDGEVVLADSAAAHLHRSISNDASTPVGLKREDLQSLEVMLFQLQIKVEAIDKNMQSEPKVASSSMPSNQAQESTQRSLSGIEDTLRTLQSTVGELSNRGPSEEANRADTQAIETLMQNTKAKLEEHAELAATRDHLETVEVAVRLTTEAVERLEARADTNAATKDDLVTLETLMQEATSSLNDLKEKTKSLDKPDEVTKTDFDAVGLICGQIKNAVNDLPSADDLSSLVDLDSITELLSEFRDSHEGLKSQYEDDVQVTAKAFDDRKQEAQTILDQLSDLKSYVEESKNELKGRMKRSNEDVRALDEILQGIEDKLDEVPNAVPDVEELKEIVTREFERAHQTLGEAKSDSKSLLEKHDEHRTALIAALDERFTTVLARYDEQHQVNEKAAHAVGERANQQEVLLASSKAMAEELKVTIEHLGDSVETISPALAEATEKMADDAKAVFNRVDEVYNRVEDNHIDDKTEHQLTRDEIAKSMLAVGELAAYHPKIMDDLTNILGMMHQLPEHFTSSRGTPDLDGLSAGLKAHFDEGLRRLPAPQSESIAQSAFPEKLDDGKIHSKLDTLLEKGVSTSTSDPEIGKKLNDLLSRPVSSEKANAQLERIDDIHQQVLTTATEVSAFVAFQTKMLSADHENKEREATQAALDLNKCLNEKENAETDIASLKQTKDTLKSEVEVLKLEHEQLMSQKLHLTADVASLETAMKLRREELQMMDARADALERRIVEGVMDHSRTLLMSKTAPAQRVPPNLNLKRVSSTASNRTATTTTPSSIANAGLGMAVKSKPASRRGGTLVPGTTNTAAPGGRRILSLSQITNNVPAGGRSLAAPTPKQPAASGLTNLKRSQSVRTQGSARKTSWAAPEQQGMGSMAGFDKENEILSEESENDENEDDAEPPNPSLMTGTATPATERRTSIGTERTGPSEYTYGTGSYFSGSYATGSYGTGSDLTDRRTSYGSTVRSNVAGLGAATSVAESIHEDETADTSEKKDDDDEEDATSSISDASDGASIFADLDSKKPSAPSPEQQQHSEPSPSRSPSPKPLTLEASPEQKHLDALKETSRPTTKDSNDHPNPLVLRTHPDGYDSGLGSDLPTADLSANGRDYFPSPVKEKGGMRFGGV